MTPYKEIDLFTSITQAFRKCLRDYAILSRDAATELGYDAPRLSQILCHGSGLNIATATKLYNYPRRIKMISDDIRKFRQGLEMLPAYVEGKYVTPHPIIGVEPIGVMAFGLGPKGEVLVIVEGGKTYLASAEMIPYAREWARQAATPRGKE
jgi:hypothetical protein